MFGKIFKDLFGVTAREELERAAIQEQFDFEKAEKHRIAAEKREARKKAKEEKEKKVVATLSPKEIANKKKEPWVDVIGFRVNPSNVRNGFFELDWNDYWIEKLKQEGYGFEGDPDEEIVGRWYRDICMNAAAAEGLDISDQDFGFLDVRKIK